MVNFTNFTRTATAAVAAFLLSAMFVTAAVGPAASASIGSSDYAAAQVQVSVQEQQA